MHWKKPLKERSILLVNAIKNSREGKLWVNGGVVCPNAWCRVYGVFKREFAVLSHWLWRYRYHKSLSI